MLGDFAIRNYEEFSFKDILINFFLKDLWRCQMSDLEISFCKIISKGLLLAFLYNVIKPKVLAFPVMFQVPDSTRI